jgi:hypothetical protein
MAADGLVQIHTHDAADPAGDPPPAEATADPPPAPGGYRLRPPRHRVDHRAVALWTIAAALRAVFVLGALGLVYALVDRSRPWLGPIIIVLSFVFLVTITVMPTRRYLIHRWEATDLAVYSLKGWLTREWRVAPLSRIQTVNTTRGPLQRMLGLATIHLTTAATQGTIVIVGLDAEVAAETADNITRVTQATPGDAT